LPLFKFNGFFIVFIWSNTPLLFALFTSPKSASDCILDAFKQEVGFCQTISIIGYFTQITLSNIHSEQYTTNAQQDKNNKIDI